MQSKLTLPLHQDEFPQEDLVPERWSHDMKTSQSSKRIIDLNLPRLYLALAFDSPWSRDALVSNLDVPLSMEVGAWWLPVSPWPARSSMDSRDPGGEITHEFFGSHRCKWWWLYGCQPKNRGTPKWMVKIMENPIKLDDLGVPIFLETPIQDQYQSMVFFFIIFHHFFLPPDIQATSLILCGRFFPFFVRLGWDFYSRGAQRQMLV